VGMFFLLGNKKPNPDIWDANNRKERAEKINAHTQTHRFTQNQRYVHRVVAIFIMTTITGVTGIISIYIYCSITWATHVGNYNKDHGASKLHSNTGNTPNNCTDTNFVRSGASWS
jgi:hypothetical protein